MNRDDSGHIVLPVVLLVTGLLFAAGALVVDGGFVRAAKRQAVAEAEAAAIQGAQALDIAEYRRSGDFRLDPIQSKALVRSYMEAARGEYEVAVQGDAVTVTVYISERTPVLSAVGIHDIRVRGTGTARLRHGVSGAEP